MKSVRAFAALFFCACLLFGCAAPPDPIPEAEPSAALTPAPTPSPTPVPAPSPTPEPRNCIVLAGGEELEWPCGVPFDEPGWTVWGEGGPKPEAAVTVEGGVREWRTGDYRLSYRTTLDGRELTAERLVRVVPQRLPEAVEPAAGTIYLTFDDGPCEYTGEVLEILARYDVKATFFVVTRQERYLDILPRIVAEGHTVGIHADWHPSSEYSGFYRSEEAFFADFLQAQRVVRAYTGQYAYCSRFPGGDVTAGWLSGTLPGGYAELYGILADMGVRSYDWNVQPESGTKTTEGTIRDFCALVHPDGMSVVLQHDTRYFSVQALEQMITWALDNGYVFSAIGRDTPPLRRFA